MINTKMDATVEIELNQILINTMSFIEISSFSWGKCVYLEQQPAACSMFKRTPTTTESKERCGFNSTCQVNFYMNGCFL